MRFSCISDKADLLPVCTASDRSACWLAKSNPGPVLEKKREGGNIYDRFAVIALPDKRIAGQATLSFKEVLKITQDVNKERIMVIFKNMHVSKRLFLLSKKELSIS